MSKSVSDQLVVSLAGEITWQNAARLRDRLMMLVQKGHRSIVLNMESVTYADSSGLAVLLSLKRRLRALDGTLLIINATEPIVRALRQTRLCDFIPVVAKEVARRRKLPIPVEEAPQSVRTMSVPSDPAYLAETRHAVSSMFLDLSLPANTVYDLVLALGEALGNAFDHGTDPKRDDAMITVTVSVYRDRIVMEVNDCGSGCCFKEGDALPVMTDARGRGIRLMLMLADSIEIRPKQVGTGTSVRLVKFIEPCADGCVEEESVS